MSAPPKEIGSIRKGKIPQTTRTLTKTNFARIAPPSAGVNSNHLPRIVGYIPKVTGTIIKETA